ncbi:hypothetical protein ACW18Z_02510 [Limosilactobacillus fermentum]
MSLWVEVPGGVASKPCLTSASLITLPSRRASLYPKDAPAGKFRLNFSNTPADQIEVRHPALGGGHGRYTGLNTETKTPC